MSFRRALNFLFRLIKRFFSNQGTIIVLIGPDGVGKTSIAKKLKKKLCVGFNVETRYFGWDCFSPLMKLVYKVYKKKNNPVKKTLVRGFAYYLEMYFRYLIILFRKKFFNKVIVLDRFFIKPRGLFIPKPDFVFLLRANPRKILERKKELSIEQIRTFYKKMCSYGLEEVSAGPPVDMVVKNILDRVAPRIINKKEVLE